LASLGGREKIKNSATATPCGEEELLERKKEDIIVNQFTYYYLFFTQIK